MSAIWPKSIYRSIALVFILLALSCAVPEEPHAQPAAVLDSSSITLAWPENGRAISSVGSLQAVMSDPQSGIRIGIPFCSGFMISRRHMLTAAHCAGRELVFNQAYLGEAGGSLSYIGFGGVIRLSYQGTVDSRSDEVEAKAPAVKDPVYLNKQLDFAVYDLTSSTMAPTWVDLRDVQSTNFEVGEIYGYPNGVPLCRAQCQFAAVVKDHVLMHDCDAMTGSSGGLIVSAVEHKPLAMHQAGSGANNAELYQQTGHFESATEFAMRRGCAKNEQSGEVEKDCILERGYNRAITLSKVAQVLADAAPELWAAIGEAAAPVVASKSQQVQ